MLGMLQIIILMGCVYLVLKVIQISQTSYLVPEAYKKQARLLTIVALILGIGGAGGAFYLLMEQSAAVTPSYWDQP